ncbi:hypothetical protein OAV88_00670 [bacterium]|nr:hypothetical protein [bacterium]
MCMCSRSLSMYTVSIDVNPSENLVQCKKYRNSHYCVKNDFLFLSLSLSALRALCAVCVC